MNDNFIDLLPDDLKDKELNIISNLINKIFEKDEDYSDAIKEKFCSKFFEKKYSMNLLEKIEINNKNYLQILTLIISYLNINTDKSYEKIVKYIDNNFSKKNLIFY